MESPIEQPHGDSPAEPSSNPDPPRKWRGRFETSLQRWTSKGYIAIAQLILSLVAAAAALGALWLVYQSIQRIEVAEGVPGQLSRATSLIESKDISVRVGGISSLGRIADDSEPDRPMILDLLGAYVRTHAPLSPACATNKPMPIDVQAALTVIGDLGVDRDYGIDLSQSCLRGADLQAAKLRGADLSGANLSKANLNRSDLSAANLTGARLNEATLVSGAKLAWANLNDAVLTDAVLGPPPETDLQNITYNADTAWPTKFTPPPSRR